MLIVLSFILLSFISSYCLLRNHTAYFGVDIQFHFKRIMELRKSIINGHSVLSNFSFNEFHGSGVMILYPYLNLLPAVLLSFIIKSKIILLYAFFMFNTFLTFIVSFYSSKNYSNFNSTAYIFSIMYSLSNIFLNYNLISNDFGIASSYTFLPLVIFGFLKLINGKKDWIQMPVGITLILYSHILNFIIIIIFLSVCLIININKLNKNVLVNLLKAILIFLILTSIIWMPFLNFYFNNLNKINTPYIGQLNNINIKDFISGLYGSKNNNTIGFFPLISIFVSIFFYKRFNRYIKQMYVLSLIIILFTLFLPWRFITSYGIFHLLNQFQFTNRFLIIPQMSFSFIFALVITKYIKSINKKRILSLIIIFVAIIIQILTGQITMINKFSNSPSVEDYIRRNGRFINIHKIINNKINNSSQFDKSLDTYYYADDDYIPKSALSVSKYVNNNLGFYNEHHKIKIKNIGYNTFYFSNKNGIKYLSLPLYSYNKENLYVYLNSKKVNYYINKEGLLTIINIRNDLKSNNQIYIKSDLDLFRIVGFILSIFGWLFIIGIIIKMNNRK